MSRKIDNYFGVDDFVDDVITEEIVLPAPKPAVWTDEQKARYTGLTVQQIQEMRKERK